MSDTPVTDRLSLEPSIEKRDVPARVWRKMARLERRANAMAEALGKEGQIDLMAQHNALAAWRDFVKENT